MHECNQAISGWKEYHMSENTISLYVYKGGQGEITEKKIEVYSDRKACRV